jgi:hypothetical protein
MDSQDHIFVARGGSPPTFPCSVAQEQFWFLDQVEPGNPALNVAVRWQLDGCVVPGLMQRAFETVIQRHEILRSSFLSADGEPRQQVMPYVPFKLATFDLTGLGEADRAAEALRIGHVAATTSFDLFEAPLLRATLVRIAATRSLLLVTVHHIVSDGWSIGILAREVGETYRAIAGHRPTSLPDLPVQEAVAGQQSVRAAGPLLAAEAARDALFRAAARSSTLRHAHRDGSHRLTPDAKSVN